MLEEGKRVHVIEVELGVCVVRLGKNTWDIGVFLIFPR